ncbi:diguanylate cyclase (GGDEF) domain-containing protein [Treponema sp. JC4]|uniref:GGDEF domain-containing protein n=1 Tax=Treponema sp. JC4 TaxID=1124982 RepID=UPI00025AFB66|nr:sensor domain-containing diguanylate cyclase [Treponema sp. JC4]EID86004.1 diguanylate cyclase (GGDEF) domain-containing protein [Treponema sp. JC4]
MDFQALVDSFSQAAVVISVEKKEEGKYGDIRFVAGNSVYKALQPNFYDNAIYSDIIPKEPNYEAFCYRCAVLKQHLHAYVDTKSMDTWVDGTYIPLDSSVDTDKLSYMIFTFYFTKNPDAQLMSDLSMESANFVVQTCINLRGADNFLEAMNKVIADIQEKTDSFCSVIFMIDEEADKIAPLCSKYRNDEASIDDFMKFLSKDVVYSWVRMLKDRDSIFVKDEHDLDELEKINPVWAKSLRGAEVKSVVLVPLMQGKKIIGVLFVTNFNVEKIVEIKEFITLTAFFLSAEISNNIMMEQLEYMSNIDILTGIKNRNAMNARVDWHISNKMQVRTPFGIIFADLNGLKTCNDNYGHEEGDKLLKNAANLLKEVFADDEIYRAGGDEFVVIVPGAEKADFEKKVSEIRKKSSYDCDVCFAIGSHWTEDAGKLREAMHLADEAMYDDKDKFYKAHKEVARRN